MIHVHLLFMTQYSVFNQSHSIIIMPEYELTYFDAHGLGEPIRLLLSRVGADWKDNWIPAVPSSGPPQIPDDIKSRETSSFLV